MHATLVALGLKIGDMPMWQRFFHSKIGLTLASVVLGIIGTLGFAPYQFWVVTLVTLGFEFFYVASLKSKGQVFWSLWLYFTAINAATLSWLNFVMHGFGEMPLLLSWLLEILLSAYLAFFHALLGCFAYSLAHRRLKAAPAKPAPVEDEDDWDDDFEDAEADADAEKSAHADAGAKAAAQPAPAAAAAATTEAKDAKPATPEQGPLHFYKNAFCLAFLPVALILADYISGWLFTGFPWMYIGYTALEGPYSAYAPLLGVRGISLVMFISAGALALTLERRYVYLPVAGVLFAIGIFCQGLTFTKDLPAIKITGIQGNVLQQIKWDPRQVMPIIGHYVDQSMPYFGKSDLIIWPESALPVFAQEIGNILQDLNSIAYGQQTPLLAGLQHLEFLSKDEFETFNSIYLLGTAPQLKQVQIYKKRQLVPFGEQVPFEKYTRQLGSIFNFPMSGFTAGEYHQSQLQLHLTATHATAAQPQAQAQHQSQTQNQNQNGAPLAADQTGDASAAAAVAGDAAGSAATDTAIGAADAAGTAGAVDSSAAVANAETDQSADQALETTTALEPSESDDVFIDERAYTNFAENDQAQKLADLGLQSVQTEQTEQTAETDDIEVSIEPAAGAAGTADATVAADDAADAGEVGEHGNVASTEHDTWINGELMEGENEWFASEIPAFPTEVAVPLEQPLTLNFIPAICYESIFPELMTSLHDQNTNGIIMISNDSWFGTTRGPDEHLGIARMRSMEMQKPMIRITNSGHTVLIDKAGKVVQSLPQDQSAILHTDFTPNTGMTPYVRFNNIPLYVLLVLLCGIGWYLRRQEINTLQQNLEALVRP